MFECIIVVYEELTLIHQSFYLSTLVVFLLMLVNSYIATVPVWGTVCKKIRLPPLVRRKSLPSSFVCRAFDDSRECLYFKILSGILANTCVFCFCFNRSDLALYFRTCQSIGLVLFVFSHLIKCCILSIGSLWS